MWKDWLLESFRFDPQENFEFWMLLKHQLIFLYSRRIIKSTFSVKLSELTKLITSLGQLFLKENLRHRDISIFRPCLNWDSEIASNIRMIPPHVLEFLILLLF